MKVLTALALLVLAAISQPAPAEELTSSLDLTAGGTRVFYGAFASSGPLADQKSRSDSGQVATGQTVTPGLVLASLPQFPSAGPFLITGIFTTRAGANQSGPPQPTSASSVTSLARFGSWTFTPLRPDLAGTQGSVHFQFKYSWAQRVQGPNTGTASLNLGLETDNSAEASPTQSLQGNGGLISSSGTSLWMPLPVTIFFGVPLNEVKWTLSNDAIAANGPGWESIAKGWAEIWDAEVRDSVGNLLVRFSDYDWIENTGPDQDIPYPVATGSMLPSPLFATVNLASNGDAVVDFFGTLEQSADLVTWTQPDPTLIGPYLIPSPLPPRQFFRARQP